MSRFHVVSPAEVRLRRFLKEKPRIGPSLVFTLLRVSEWAKSIQAGEAENPLRRKLTHSATGSEPIQQIAENLIERASGIERDLLLKSIQELLFYCVNFETNLNLEQIKTRLKGFLDQEKRFAFMQQFLCFYVFNYVSFYTSDSFRAMSSTPQVFEQEMEQVEKICERTVASALEPYEQAESVLDPTAAEELIQKIEQRLRGE